MNSRFATFGDIKNSPNSGSYSEYLKTKRIKRSEYFKTRNCYPFKTPLESGEYSARKYLDYVKIYGSLNSFDKSQLYVNLYTKVNLNNWEPSINGTSVNVDFSSFPPTIVYEPQSQIYYEQCMLNPYAPWTQYNFVGTLEESEIVSEVELELENPPEYV